MTRTKLLITLIVSLILINLGTLCFLFLSSKPSRHFNHRNNPQKIEGPKKIIAKRLNFNESQRKSFDELVQEHKKTLFDLRAKDRELHDELFALLREENINLIARDSLLIETSNNQKNIDVLNFDHFQKIKTLCRADQIDQYNDLIQELGHLFKTEGPSNRRPHQ